MYGAAVSIETMPENGARGETERELATATCHNGFVLLPLLEENSKVKGNTL